MNEEQFSSSVEFSEDLSFYLRVDPTDGALELHIETRDDVDQTVRIVAIDGSLARFASVASDIGLQVDEDGRIKIQDP